MNEKKQRSTEALPKPRRTFYTLVGKRLLDIFLSGFAIILLSPLLLFISVLELIFHGRPILVSQERPGLKGKPFRLYKFRSMTNATDKDGNLLPEAQRSTKFGRFIRRFSLDELPELFCILTGKMSIIGPRPLLVKYMPLYTKRHRRRHLVRPGFALVPLKPMKTWTWNDQFENDIWYIENCSLSVDIQMLFAVLREAISGAEYRVGGDREEFNGKNLFTDAKAQNNH